MLGVQPKPEGVLSNRAAGLLMFSLLSWLMPGSAGLSPQHKHGQVQIFRREKVLRQKTNNIPSHVVKGEIWYVYYRYIMDLWDGVW